MSAPAPAVDQPWVKYARELVGLKEIIGSRHEAKILQFFAEAGHAGIKDDETAWCAAFLNAMLRRAGYAGTGSLAARSFLTWGEKLTKPKIGCIVVFKRGNSTWQGHVGFVVGITATTLQVLAGNQGNAVSIQPFPIDSSVLGYRWPAVKSAPAAKTVAPAKTAVTVGGAAVGGAVVAAAGKAAVDAGWGPNEWALLLVAVAAMSAVFYFGWRWWQGRKVEARATTSAAALIETAKAKPEKPRARRKPAAKKAAPKRTNRKTKTAARRHRA